MTNKSSFFSTIFFSGFLFWLPLAMQLFSPPPRVKTLTQLNTVEPAECGGSRGFHIFPVDGFGGGPDTILPYDPGFLVPEYPFDSVGPPAQGAYTIANNTRHWEGEALQWLDTGDSDPNFDEGYMMIVNGGSPAGVFMEYTIGVCPSTTYNFGFNILNLYDTLQPLALLPNIDVFIDGALFYSAGDIPHNGQWTYHPFSFKTQPDVTAITISLINNTAGGEGNVFALDDFFLGPCGPDLLAEEVAPQAHCIGDTIQLQLSVLGAPFDTNYVQWQTSLNEGVRWTDFGEPVTDPVFTVEGLPDGVWFRALVANTRMGINSFTCRVITNEVIIQYNDFDSCPNYTVTDIGALCTGSLGNNIFPEGSFGSGEENTLATDPGISPFYQYQPNPPPNDGFYTITNNTTMWPSFGEGWLDTRDNSPDPNGYFMVINADTNPGIFYTDTVEVCGNTLYEFSADVFNLHENQPFFVNPNIEFQIDGVSILRSGEVPQDSMWHTYGFTFTTKPDVTELILSVRNYAPGGGDFIGNDFALDNISLRPCGPVVVALEVEPQPRCPGDLVEILARISTGYPNPSVLWQISQDEGENWADFSGPSPDTVLLIGGLPPNAQFRAVVAESPEKVFLPSCRILSNSVILDYAPLENCWETPINLTGDLCNGNLGANGVPNGDFGRDTSLFAAPLEADITSYFFVRDSFERDGSYTITNDFHYDPCYGLLQDTCWIPLQDASGDSLGYFMVVNSDFEPGIFFRNEVTGLCEDITYQFSASIINLNRTFFYPSDSTSTDTITLPNVDFIIGEPGVTPEEQTFAPAIYNTGDILNDSMWHTFGFTFTTKPGVSDLSLALRNNAPGGAGNDLAFDNIIISVCGPESTIAPYTICNDDPLTLQAEIVGDQFPNRFIQWEQSTDNGMSWSAISGATNEELLVNTPVPGHQYRYLVANEQAHLSEPLCHVSSEIDTIVIQTTAVTSLEETICQGESLTVNAETYTETGFYQQILTAESGCDSVLQIDLTVLDTINKVLNIRVCIGEEFEGVSLTQDTTLFFLGSTTTGCDSTLQVNVEVSDLRPFEISGDPVLCFGEEEVLTAPIEGFYIWSTGDITQNITVSEEGVYSVTIMDGFGCQEEASVTVEQSRLLPFTIEGDSLLCDGETTTLIAQTEAITYLWSTGERTQEIEVNASGDYRVTVTDELGCQLETAITVQVSDLVPFSILGDTILCTGESTTLLVPLNGHYLWSTGDTTQSISVNSNGNYSVTVSDDLGCEEIASVSVQVSELEPFTLPVNDTLCIGESIILTGPDNGTFAWSTGATTQSITVSTGGDYSLTVTDTLGCTEFSATTVAATQLSDPLSISGGTVLCGNDITTLTADANGTYLWSTDETTQSIDVNAAGDYSVTVTDALGCTVSATVTVSQSQLSASVTVEASTCAGDANGSLIVTNVNGGTGKISYQLNGSTAQESPVFEDLMAGTYAVRVLDEAGCTYEEEVALPDGDPLSVSILPIDKPIRAGDSIRLQPTIDGEPTLIVWEPSDGLSCTDCLTPIAKPTTTTTYTLTITSASGCTQSASITIEVDNSRRIYIPNVFAPNSQEANNQFFTIFGGSDIQQINQLVIFDRWGNQIFQAQNITPGDPAGAWDGTHQGQAAQSGVYVYFATVTFVDGIEEVYSGDVTLVR